MRIHSRLSIGEKEREKVDCTCLRGQRKIRFGKRVQGRKLGEAAANEWLFGLEKAED